MSGLEITVVLMGLLLGYWLVSQFLTSRPLAPKNTRNDAPPPTEPPWHTVLNVSPNASNEEVRHAYRTMIGKYHPDKVASLGEELRALAEKKSKEIDTAYQQALRERGEDA